MQPDKVKSINQLTTARVSIMVTEQKCIVIILSGYVDTYNSTFFQKRVVSP